MTSITPEPRNEIYAAIDRERHHQNLKYGDAHDRNLGILTWIDIALRDLLIARTAPDHDHALVELLRVAAVCIACLEVHGLVERDDLGKDEKTAE